MAQETKDIKCSCGADAEYICTCGTVLCGEDPCNKCDGGSVYRVGELLFVYGSLRVGMHNHYLLKGAEFVTKAILGDYKLVSLGSYPAIYETLSDCDSVIGEVYRVTSEQLQLIRNMELGAGYKEVIARPSTTDRIYPSIIYIKTEEQVEGLERVEHGDWKKYMDGEKNET